jgi:hypothetical protein
MRLNGPEAVIVARAGPTDRDETALMGNRTRERDSISGPDPGAVRCGTAGIPRGRDAAAPVLPSSAGEDPGRGRGG